MLSYRSQLLSILCFCVCSMLALSLPAPAQATTDATLLEVESQAFSVSAEGLQGRLAVITLTPAQGYYFYAADPGATGRPVEIVARTEDVERQVLYPRGQAKPDIFDLSLFANVHTNATRFYVPLPDEDTGSLFWTASVLMCSATNCQPVSREGVTAVSKPLPRAEAQGWWPEYVTLRQHDTPSFSPSRQPAVFARDTVQTDWDFTPHYFLESLEVKSLTKALLLGLIAGFILNFMPCVLPVVSLKLSTLLSAGSMQDKTQRIRHFRRHNIWFAAGILCFFLLLALLLSAAGLVWGAAFQSKPLVSALVVLVFALGLSMFGVFHLPVLDLKAAHAESKGFSRGQAFFTGMTATLLATPCSGPFLGGVLGWAFVQSPLALTAVFFGVGLGMALPYLAMAAYPSLALLVPKPGSWVQVLERLVGFFLMGTVVYLLHILPDALWPDMLILLWFTALTAWIWGRFSGLEKSFGQRMSVRLACVGALLVVAWWLAQPPDPHPGWEPFTTASFEETLGKQPIIVNVTADWCPNCKVLEAGTLHADNLRRWVQQYNARLIQVDITEPTPEGEAFLKALGSASIPVVALFPTGAQATQPLVLRDLFTTGQMDAALLRAFSQPTSAP